MEATEETILVSQMPAPGGLASILAISSPTMPIQGSPKIGPYQRKSRTNNITTDTQTAKWLIFSSFIIVRFS